MRKLGGHFRSTGWRRPIGCLKLKVIFCKRATNYRALLRKMICKDQASYVSSPSCTANQSSKACDVAQYPRQKHTATHCNTLQHTAPHCTTLHHTATLCNTLQHTRLDKSSEPCDVAQYPRQKHTATHCNALQHTVTHCNTLQRMHSTHNKRTI